MDGIILGDGTFRIRRRGTDEKGQRLLIKFDSYAIVSVAESQLIYEKLLINHVAAIIRKHRAA